MIGSPVSSCARASPCATACGRGALPPWLAALIVFAVFVIIAAVLAFLGLRFFKKMGQEPSTGESLKKDVDAVKGLGEYGEH